MRVFGLTDTGLVRQENQDVFRTSVTEQYAILVVCDGMGGTNGGKLASTIASDCFMQVMTEALTEKLPVERITELLRQAVAQCNQAVREKAATAEELSRMGTTLVGAACDEGLAVICNIGDSRAYHLTREGIVQITRDHSVVENMVERGQITLSEARHHPSRNYITRALGPDETVEADVFTLPWQEGDFLLLCSDGLVNTVTDQEMLFEVIQSPDAAHCPQRLLEIAKKNGAPDNVTVVLLQNFGKEMA